MMLVTYCCYHIHMIDLILGILPLIVLLWIGSRLHAILHELRTITTLLQGQKPHE